MLFTLSLCVCVCACVRACACVRRKGGVCVASVAYEWPEVTGSVVLWEEQMMVVSFVLATNSVLTSFITTHKLMLLLDSFVICSMSMHLW